MNKAESSGANVSQVQMESVENQIIVYQPNETVRLDVRLENETVWLNRHQMAQLFGRDVKTIGKHIANALSEELASSSVVADFATTQRQQNPTSATFAQVEVLQNPTVANFATVQQEGGREVVRKVEYYSLDVILSVGYRVKIGERSGMGLSQLYGNWEEAGYTRPQLSESFNPERTKVEIEVEVAEKRGEYTENSTESACKLTETEERIVAILRQNKFATQGGISAQLGITRTYITKIMGGLQARKIIRRIGPDKGGYWEVSRMVNGILKNGEEA